MSGPPAAPEGSPSRRWLGRGLLLVLATAIVSGVSTFVNGYAVAGTGSDAFVTVRNALVAFALVPAAVLVARRASVRPTAREAGLLAVIGLVGGAIPFLLFFHGLALAAAAGATTSASFVYRLLFLFATLLGVVVLAERARPRLVVAGLLLLAGNALLLALTGPLWSDGTGFVLAATVLWAVEYTLSKRLLRRLPSTVVGAGRMGFGAAILGSYLVLAGEASAPLGFSMATWGWIGVSALLLGAFVATWYAGLARVDLGTAATVLVLGYPVTWLLALAVRGGPAPWGPAVGALLVAGGVAAAIGASGARAIRAAVAPTGGAPAG